MKLVWPPGFDIPNNFNVHRSDNDPLIMTWISMLKACNYTGHITLDRKHGWWVDEEIYFKNGEIIDTITDEKPTII